ncbi:hypothetical protein [Streptococcus henryi]
MSSSVLILIVFLALYHNYQKICEIYQEKTIPKLGWLQTALITPTGIHSSNGNPNGR